MIAHVLSSKPINRLLDSGVTEQLGALSNFAIQGALCEEAYKSTKFAKFPTSKWSSYRQNQGKPKPQRQVKTSITGI